MLHLIIFKRLCNSCNKTTGILQAINFHGYDEILSGDENGSFDIPEIENLIGRFYEREEISCELCGKVADFHFYDFEIDNKKVNANSANSKKSHYKILLQEKRIVIKFKKIVPLVEELHSSQNGLNEINFDNGYGAGLLEINESTVKVFDTVRNLMRELFEGTINKIEYSDSGKILLIQGIGPSMWDSSPVSFKISFGVQQVGNKKLTKHDNYYVDIEPSINNNRFKSNYLLFEEESFFVPE